MLGECSPRVLKRLRTQHHPTLEHGRRGVRGGAAQRNFGTLLACLARRASIDARWRHLGYFPRGPTVTIAAFLPVERARDSLTPLFAIAAGPRGSIVAGGVSRPGSQGGEALMLWRGDSAKRNVLRPAADHVRALLRIGENDIAVADESGSVSVWCLRPPHTRQFELAAQQTPVLALALLARSAQRRDQTLATGGVGGVVQLWNLRTHERIGALAPSLPNDSIFSMCTIREGRDLFLCEQLAGVVEVCVGPEARPTMERRAAGYEPPLVGVRCVCALRGAFSAAMGTSRGVRKVILRRATHPPAVRQAPSWTSLVLSAMWSTGEIKAIAAIEPAGASDGVAAAERAPHRFVATGSSDGSLHIWSIAALRCVCELTGHSASVCALSFRLHCGVRFLVSGENNGRCGRLLTHDIGAVLAEIGADSDDEIAVSANSARGTRGT